MYSLFLFSTLLLQTGAPASSPASSSNVESANQPTTNAFATAEDDSAQLSQQFVKQWFAQLADRDPIQREIAMQRLMGLKKDELPQLKAAITEAGANISPTQESAVHDVVLQVFLAGEQFQIDSAAGGFLGVRFLPINGDAPDTPDVGNADPANINGQDNGLGVVVIFSRVPGFVASRWLRDGDVVIGIRESKTRINSVEALQRVIADYKPGKLIHMLIERSGKRITVPIVLDSRPKDSASLIDTRLVEMAQAEAYWDTEFAPLFPKPATLEEAE